jgi:hypothetical protein
MTDPASGTEQPIGTPPQGEAPVGSEGRTIEQVEAEWRQRQAGKDREAQALRDRLAAYEAAEAQRKAADEQRRTAELGEVEALRRQLAEERSAAAVALRKVQFPNAADVLDPSALAAMDEAKLAALETRLGAPARGAAPAAVIDPNAPTRTVPTAQAAGAPK